MIRLLHLRPLSLSKALRRLLTRIPAAACLLALLLCSILVAGSQTASQAVAVNDAREVGIIVLPAQDQADNALKALRAGYSFPVFAKLHSQDPSAGMGGSLGPLSNAPLAPSLLQAARSLHVGEYTSVIPVLKGFAILTLLAPQPPDPTFADASLGRLVSTGDVRYGIDVSGDTTENAVFRQYPKSAGWEHNLQAVCDLRKASHKDAVQQMSAMLAQAISDTSGRFGPQDLMQGHGALSQLHAFYGDMNESIAHASAAYDIARQNAPQAVPYLLETLGALYLHKWEMESGAYRSASDSFPPSQLHTSPANSSDAQQAISFFTQFLEARPDDMEVRWLLNLTYASLGAYPSKVPSNSLISPASFQSREDIGLFHDVAKSAGLDVFSEAGGVIVDDFDNDGLLDVVTSSMDVCEPMHLFHNNGDGTFTDVATKAGLGAQLGGLNLVAADYNNDGCMDILVLRGGWEFPVRKSLLKNNCDGTFTDVTAASGLDAVVTSSQTAVWADFNNDGLLDLFIGNENAPSQLFRNKGNGTFDDVSHAAGVDRTAYTKGVTAADYDNDGFVDLYVSNINEANFLYHNNGDGTFTEIARQAGVQAPWFSFATWFFDYDNDGWPDLFVNSYFNSPDEVIRSAQGLPTHVETLKLYRNLHNGAFKDVTAEVGLDKVLMPMGANFGDVDNDGFLDLYLGQGQPSFTGILPHMLLRNDAGKRFTDVTASSGTGELHKGHAVAFADLERTGHEDILAEAGGAVFSDKHAMRVFANPGDTNDWINLKLVGEKTNRSAVGAEIHITVQNGKAAQRSIFRRVGESSSFGVNPLEQHIGLGPSARIITIDISWPVSRSTQHFTHVEKNCFLQIQEFASSYTQLVRRPVRLGSVHVASR